MLGWPEGELFQKGNRTRKYVEWRRGGGGKKGNEGELGSKKNG